MKIILFYEVLFFWLETCWLLLLHEVVPKVCFSTSIRTFISLFFLGRAGLTRRNALLMPLNKGYVMMEFTELRNAGGKLGLK